MKRYLSLALIFLMLPAFLAVPAMAAENGFWYELLDYGYSSRGTNRFSLPQVDSVNSYYVSYTNPTKVTLERMALYFKTDATDPGISTTSNTLTVQMIVPGYFVAYGVLGKTQAEFNFDHSDGTYLEILSFKVSTIRYDQFEVPVVGNLHAYGADDVIPFSYRADGVSASVEWVSNTQFDNSFWSEMTIYDWYKYDYIDVHVAVWGNSITSFAASLSDGSLIPVSVNSYDNGPDENTSLYILNLRVDLTQVVKYTTSDLSINISGTVYRGEYAKFTIFGASGIILPSTNNLFVYWFTQLQGWLTNGYNSVTSSIASWGQNLLDGINALPDKIVEALEAVFVPSDSVVQDMGEQSEQLAQDRFGGAYEGALIIDEFASQLRPQQATQILTVPVVNLDILGVPFPLGGWEVDLVPDGAELIVETCKILIDIVATLAFVNGLRNRLERTLEK